MDSVTTMEAMNEKIMAMDMARAEIRTVDSQESLGGDVTVLVMGHLTGGDGVHREFSQSFLLAPQEKGYSVLSDMFRYVGEDPAPAAAEVQPEAGAVVPTVAAPLANGTAGAAVEPAAPEHGVFGESLNQFDLMTDLLGTPSKETISLIRNDKARRYLSSMRKQPIPFPEKFPNADPSALKLLQRLLAFDPKDRPTAEEALADPYFKCLAKVEREPSCQPISKMEFEFERRKVTKEDVKELIFREILEYHPQLLKDYMNGSDKTSFLYPSAVDNFRRQFANLEENGGKSGTIDRKHVSLPRTTTVHSTPIPPKEGPDATSRVPQRIPTARPGRVVGPVMPFEKASVADPRNARMVARNPVVPPAAANSSVCCYHLKSDCSDRQHQQELEKDRMRYRPAQHFMDAKVVPEIAPDTRSSPYYIPRSAPKADLTDRAALQGNMLHGIAPFNGIVAVAGGYSKVGTVQYGVSRMY